MPKRNKELRAFMSKLPCEVCGDRYQVSGHHIISFKSRPDLDIKENLIALCFSHHREWHDIGTFSFVDKYKIESNLLDRGFYFDEYAKKWRFEKHGQ